MPFGGVFSGDYGQGVSVDIVAEGFKMLVFDDAREGDVGGGVIYHGIALMVRFLEGFGLKTHSAVVEVSVAVSEILIYAACEDDFVGHRLPMASVGKKISVCEHVAAIEQCFYQRVIAAYGDTLICIVEIVVVKNQSDGQSADDESRQLRAGSAPLLLGVAFDELPVDVASDQHQGLFFKVARLGDTCFLHRLHGFAALLVEFGRCFGRSASAPHLVERVHIEGEVVHLAVRSHSHRAVGIAVEFRITVDKIPHFAVGCMEYVCAIAVYVDSVYVFAINIAADVVTLFDY